MGGHCGCQPARTLCSEVSSASSDGIFFSVAMTTPLVALMPMDVLPPATAWEPGEGGGGGGGEVADE